MTVDFFDLSLADWSLFWLILDAVIFPLERTQ
jgi:hypothetical protein